MQNPPKAAKSPSFAKATDLQWVLAASGGTLVSLGLASTADASLVQITQSGNFVSQATTANFNTDLTGALTGDTAADVSWSPFANSSTFFGFQAKLNSGGGTVANALFAPSFTSMVASVNGVTSNDPTLTGPVTATALVAITFTDSTINGGAATNGLVQIIATAQNNNTAQLDVTRLIFDDANAGSSLAGVSAADPDYAEFSPGGGTAVPEASELALLALGAGGVMAHRRRKRKVA